VEVTRNGRISRGAKCRYDAVSGSALVELGIRSKVSWPTLLALWRKDAESAPKSFTLRSLSDIGSEAVALTEKEPRFFAQTVAFVDGGQLVELRAERMRTDVLAALESAARSISKA